MDTDANHYTINELIDVFELDKPVQLSQLMKHAKQNIRQISQQNKEENPSHLVNFIVNSFERLCKAHNFSHTESMIQELRSTTQQDPVLPPLDEASTHTVGSHVVINHTNTLDTSSRVSSGKLNPLRKQYKTQLISIHSKFRENYNKTKSTDYQYTLPTPLKNVVSMRVLTAEIPTCMYNISSVLDNHEFTILSYDSSVNPIVKTAQTIKVRDGKYCGPDLEDYLNKHVFTVDNSLNHVACAYDTVTCKFYFFVDRRDISDGGAGPTTTMAFDIDFRVQTDLTRPPILNLGWILGYRNPIYTYTNNYVTQDKTSYHWHEGFNPESTFTIMASNYYILSIDDYNHNYHQTMQNPFQQGTMKQNGLLCKILNRGKNLPINLFYDEYDMKRTYFGPVNIDKLHIELLDDMGRHVDINNNDYSFSILVETVYDL